MDCGAESAIEYGLAKATARYLKFGQERFVTRDNEFRVDVVKCEFSTEKDMRVAIELVGRTADIVEPDAAQHCNAFIVMPEKLRKFENETKEESPPTPRSDSEEEATDKDDEPTKEDIDFIDKEGDEDSAWAEESSGEDESEDSEYQSG